VWSKALQERLPYAEELVANDSVRGKASDYSESSFLNDLFSPPNPATYAVLDREVLE
jgi:hypothetical protein